METQLPNSEKLFQLVSLDKSVKTTGGVLKTGRYLIGRAESCDIIIHTTVVSSVHAVLEVTAQGLKIYDMNSKNGTYIEKEKIVAKEISEGQILSFGNIPFKLEKYKVDTALPPVLDALEPVGGEASVLKSLPGAVPEFSEQVSSPEKFVEKTDSDAPYIIYPLSVDPNSDYSEYIFEDKDEMYPIFKYEVDKHAVEVIILYKDKVYSVDYLPSKNAVYEIAGLRKASGHDVEFPYLGKEERLPFVEIQSGNCVVYQLHKYEMLYLSNDNVQKASDGRVNIQDDDIVKLSNGDLEIYVRKVPAPPKVKPAPFFRRDNQMRKYLWMVMLFVLVPLVSLYLFPVDKELLDEKDPERVATILYKQKLKINTNKAVADTQKKVNKRQKSNEKKHTKRDPKKDKKANPTKTNKPKNTKKDPGKKASQSIDKPKAVEKPQKKTSDTPEKGGKKRPQNTTEKQARKAKSNPTKTGRIDAYKSFNFKSNMSKLRARGGLLSGAKTAQTSSQNDISNPSVNQGSGIVKTAKDGTDLGVRLSDQVGTKLRRRRGSEGLTTKTGVYTAGIPSETVVLGSMDPDVIRQILREHIPQFRSCYMVALGTQRNLSGQIKLAFTIGASGTVVRAGVHGASTLPIKVRGCVVNVLRGIEFPRPLGGGTVDVRQPFNFYPKRI